MADARGFVRCDGCGMRTSEAALQGGLCSDCREGEGWPYGDGPRPLAQAAHMAQAAMGYVAPWCSCVEIAGSIRRRCADVGDLELVCVPRDRAGLYTALVERPPFSQPFRWIKPGTSEIVPWQPKRDGKYWRAVLPCGMKADFFFAEPGNAGLILAIRTGSRAFSQALVTRAKAIGHPSREGYLRQSAALDAGVIPTPSEPELFALLGLEWTAPEERTDAAALQVIRRAA